MDYITLLLGTAAIAALVGLAFMSGWELGSANGIDRERDLADRRIKALLEKLNKLERRLGLRKRRASK
jgi:L-cystine uptake protein TcyP (sodium:dicarboxylate symporter family)